MRIRFAHGIVWVLYGTVVCVSTVAAQKPDKPNPQQVSWSPTRDPAPLIAAIDREWSARLQQAQRLPARRCDDSKFLRRAALDVTGRIPTLSQTRAFLNDTAPDKRRAWVDSLLASRAYAEHLARCWKRLIQPPDLTSTKSSVDRFAPWLADQLAAGRPWNEVVYELLTVEVDVTRDPRGAFFAANSEAATPKPNLLAASVGRVFLGVQIGCAECHNHPFSEWTQEDFWGLAAYFGRTRKVSKANFTLTEAADRDIAWTNTAITIPEGSGKASGKIVPARLFDGGEPRSQAEPLRPQLAQWVTAPSNPYFARALVNRLWAHCFGRGLLEPLDDQREGNEPSHPELLQLLADEFIASNFDVRHILRCILLSEPYQLDAQPVGSTPVDPSLFSHHLGRAMTPDLLYDSLGVAFHAEVLSSSTRPGKPFDKSLLKTRGSFALEPRETFVRFFGRASLDDTGEVFSLGIPQLLRLMNSPELNRAPPFLADLIRVEPDVKRRIDTLVLIVYGRHATPEEQAELTRLVIDDVDAVARYTSVFWVLLNSSEFIVHD